jgi:hypothetical protein
MTTMQKLFFGRLALLRGAHHLAVQLRTILVLALRAPRSASHKIAFSKVAS